LFVWHLGLLQPKKWVTTIQILSPDIFAGLAGIAFWTLPGYYLWRHPLTERVLRASYRTAHVVLASPILVVLLLSGVYGTARYSTLFSSCVQLESVWADLRHVGAARPLEPPFDFLHINEPRIRSLSAQLEPALREEQRKIQVASNASVEGKVNTTVASVGAGGSQQRSETSEMKAVSWSLDRSTSELIVGLSARSQLPVYSDSGAWLIPRMAGPATDAIKAFGAAVRGEAYDSSSLRVIDSAQTKSADLVKRLLEDMATELQGLKGYLVVDGKWTIDLDGGNGRLEHAFYPDGSKEGAAFTCSVPAAVLPKGQSLADLRIFATVSSTDGRHIELTPLAVFY